MPAFSTWRLPEPRQLVPERPSPNGRRAIPAQKKRRPNGPAGGGLRARAATGNDPPGRLNWIAGGRHAENSFRRRQETPDSRGVDLQAL